MDRAQDAAVAGKQRSSKTTRTDSATFVISERDVGSLAVRTGIAAEIEEERYMLLLAAKLVLARIRAGKVPIGDVYEHALAAAIKMAEPIK